MGFAGGAVATRSRTCTHRSRESEGGAGSTGAGTRSGLRRVLGKLQLAGLPDLPTDYAATPPPSAADSQQPVENVRSTFTRP
jgi:hypothetical protein